MLYETSNLSAFGLMTWINQSSELTLALMQNYLPTTPSKQFLQLPFIEHQWWLRNFPRKSKSHILNWFWKKRHKWHWTPAWIYMYSTIQIWSNISWVTFAREAQNNHVRFHRKTLCCSLFHQFDLLLMHLSDEKAHVFFMTTLVMFIYTHTSKHRELRLELLNAY